MGTAMPDHCPSVIQREAAYVGCGIDMEARENAEAENLARGEGRRACLFARGGLDGVEGDVLEPVALVDVLLVEQQRVGVDVLHLLESLLDQQGGDSVEGQRIGGRGAWGRIFGERSHGLKGGGLGLQVPRHGSGWGLGPEGGWAGWAGRAGEGMRCRVEAAR
ncbi:hypothetical protein K505DRAFT_72211 [Melanomma pulvis-pyrius CBS 109.77]|uniref:Uncharacterized protein n=1 Tax=Melanomma pulvis-pyrius CBS 109.77 TaxID=1314802 RepID=A0A6A6X4A4_9PLEO|nr:hypothetical protein K505DRAFT_72211 [Melanomma pulvis-pyrius CBS 109.77]